jgi:hypothetical protein
MEHVLAQQKQGGKTVELIKKAVPNFNSNEVLLIPEPGKTPKYSVGAGPLSYNVQRPNGEIIQLNGSKSAIERCMEQVQQH